MIKYFISNDLLKGDIIGKFCIEGIKNEDESQYFITRFIPTIMCQHKSCLGNIVQIRKDPQLNFICHPNSKFSHGDDISEKPLSFQQALVLVYNNSEINSLLKYCSDVFFRDVGFDVTFLFQSFAKHSNYKFKFHEEKYDSNFGSSYLQPPGDFISRSCHRSYLYKLAKFKIQSCKANDVARNITCMVLEFLLAVALVICSSFILQKYGDFEFHMENMKSLILFLVKFLQDLLTWLMGVPVGFKLNRPLSRVLGQFYMFHVTIWENYMLSIIYPLVPYFVALVPWLTPLGISFFLCLLLDILSLASLHVICFYVYASKLYRFQIIILCSLYRLFHGQKWNPFKQRVDTGPPEIDRMFTSTLILALCVFLLPTTGIYYLVFAMFELVLLVFEYFVCCIVDGILELPVLDLLTWLFHHSCHKKIVRINRESGIRHCLVLTIQFQRSSLFSIFKMKNVLRSHIRPPFCIWNVLSSLMKGLTLKRLEISS